MQKLTRRGLIKQASMSAGVIGMLATTVPVQAHSMSTLNASTEEIEQSTAAGESLVICVMPATGTLTVLRGEREIIIKDTALVQRLLAL